MTDKEIVERAKEAEKRTGFGELVHSPISKGVNSAFGIGFIEDMVEYRNSLQEEPVSEDLEREIDSYFSKWLQGASDEGCFNPDSQLVSIYDCHRIARHFANWQKQQMERYRIEHCKSLTNEQAELESNFVSSHVEKNNRIPTFIDAIEYGIEYGKQQKDESKVLTEEQCRKIRDDAFELGKDAMKQQLMAKAVDAIVQPYDAEIWLNSQNDLKEFAEGEEVKVIVIKKDEL